MKQHLLVSSCLRLSVVNCAKAIDILRHPTWHAQLPLLHCAPQPFGWGPSEVRKFWNFTSWNLTKKWLKRLNMWDKNWGFVAKTAMLQFDKLDFRFGRLWVSPWPCNSEFTKPWAAKSMPGTFQNPICHLNISLSYPWQRLRCAWKAYSGLPQVSWVQVRGGRPQGREEVVSIHLKKWGYSLVLNIVWLWQHDVVW